MSYAAEVIADGSGEWAGNALRFATEDEARRYADDLHIRWTLVLQTRVVSSESPVNYSYSSEGQLNRLDRP